jgi:hypothetical protein
MLLPLTPAATRSGTHRSAPGPLRWLRPALMRPHYALGALTEPAGSRRSSGLRNAELVAFRILHDRPPVVPLVHVGNSCRAQLDESGDLGFSIRSGQIDVHAILGGLPLGHLGEQQVGLPPRCQPRVSRCSGMPIEANSLDGFGSRGRPRATDRNRATVSASSQSTVTAASLTVTPCPPSCVENDAPVPWVDASHLPRSARTSPPCGRGRRIVSWPAAGAARQAPRA